MPKYGKISTLKIIFFSFRLYIKIFEIFSFLLIPNMSYFREIWISLLVSRFHGIAQYSILPQLQWANYYNLYLLHLDLLHSVFGKIHQMGLRVQMQFNWYCIFKHCLLFSNTSFKSVLLKMFEAFFKVSNPVMAAAMTSSSPVMHFHCDGFIPCKICYELLSGSAEFFVESQYCL